MMICWLIVYLVVGYCMTDGLYHKKDKHNTYLKSDMDKQGELFGYVLFLPIILIRDLFNKRNK